MTAIIPPRTFNPLERRSSMPYAQGLAGWWSAYREPVEANSSKLDLILTRQISAEGAQVLCVFGVGLGESSEGEFGAPSVAWARWGSPWFAPPMILRFDIRSDRAGWTGVGEHCATTAGTLVGS
jgi:hypothetical protein